MVRLFLAAVCSVVSGNLLITYLEKTLNSAQSLDTLRDVLLTAENRAAAAAAYPQDLLANKLVAWMAGAFLAGLVLSSILKQKNKWVHAIVVLFYLTAAYVNIVIVPHPAWVAAAIPAVFIVPFLGGYGLAAYISEVQRMPVFEEQKNSSTNGQPAV